ncbi:unnamed protein product [Penicillium salamii]|uniref:Zn(2)-C6 fungal-type domain-containing protein n=1 Tax=Penicillium salamii TaxID=1612424 RepID=A0A9W4IX63_9EURO|nr:unnamed protein product [Penicillium salamii]CAG8017929.1 unnamed protein product [Penicillium salamii]CAG8125353.1 unnamed protein product [Penicillium salamii]CAG8307649.1 unnamed protein product [Penicillium salamii]CAG8318459.1 unnamed protein product [Penicillium salamii]
MPRPRRPGAPEPKRRSRKGCCGEEKPACLNCERQGELCDYSVRLNWGGRTKRASVDSPGSQSSGYGGGSGMIGLSGSFSINTASPTSFPTPMSNSADGVPPRPGDIASPGAISPTTPAPARPFDSPRPDPEGISSPSQFEAGFSTTWGEQSPPSMTSSSGTLTQFQLGQHTFDNTSFPTGIEQGLGLRSLSAFAFHANPVSQPVSFMRHSVDGSHGHPDSTVLHAHDKEHITHSSHEGNQSHLNLDSLSNKAGDSGSPDDVDALHSLLFGAHRMSVEQSNAAPSPGLNATPTAMESTHEYSIDLAGNHRTIPDSIQPTDETPQEFSLAENKWQTYLNSVTDNYGLDSGRSDQDLSFNNDHAAIDINYALDLISSRGHSQDASQSTVSQSVPEAQAQVQFCSGYYASPVPINIPRYLSPLPSSLLENPINLMYFHHFLNHTARMLVPHNCDNNPFISVLPSMAIGDSNLLNLLLAYSASHRARYLGHPEPANRIAHWVSQVFPTLRIALESSHENITDSHLATALMLLSLKIVSPGTFEAPITWKSHLKLARDLFLARSEYMAQPGNRIGAFFSRWLGYLDTMGSLSCRHAGPPLTIYSSILAACSSSEGHDEYAVDCFTGFSPRTGVFLIRLASLVQKYDNQRFDEMGHFQHDWHASADLVLEAQSVLGEIDGISERAHANPDHHQGIESSDMMAIEEAFRFAGLLHLHRRVLGSPPDSFPVKEVLRKLVDALGRMRPGAATEVCSLFPLFTAGCESRDPIQRSKLLDLFIVLERSGMKQIQNARQLMQHCWERKLPWVALAGGQFFG